MKITKDQLRNIDVEAYIGFIETQCEEMGKAVISLPFFKQRLKILTLSKWDWHCYFIQSGKYSAWYDRYQELIRAKIAKIKAQIEESEKALEGVISLSDPAQTISIINESPRDLSMRIAETIDFRAIELGLQTMRHLFETSIECDLEAINNKLCFDKGAINRELEKAENEDFKFLEWMLEGQIYRQYIFDRNVVFEFARLEFLHRLATGEYSTTPEAMPDKPLKWVGKTAHLGYYMNALADAGYIDAPKKKNGDTNYNEFARQICKAFEFDGNNTASLAKNLSPDGNNMEIVNKDKISIPHRKEIS